jgi:hypothetical protein
MKQNANASRGEKRPSGRKPVGVAYNLTHFVLSAAEPWRGAQSGGRSWCSLPKSKVAEYGRASGPELRLSVPDFSLGPTPAGVALLILGLGHDMMAATRRAWSRPLPVRSAILLTMPAAPELDLE